MRLGLLLAAAALLAGCASSHGSTRADPPTSTTRTVRDPITQTISVESGGYGGPTGASAGLGGTDWDIYCAGRDPWPNLSGCPSMRRADADLKASGATVTHFMVDPPAGHGGFLKNPKDVDLVLADFA